jgi:hypothetical protein
MLSMKRSSGIISASFVTPRMSSYLREQFHDLPLPLVRPALSSFPFKIEVSNLSIVLWISFWNRLCIQFSRYVSGFISHTTLGIS